MKRIICITMISICLPLVFWYPNIGQTEGETPEVVINEVAWAGSSVSSADEWIELKNTTDVDIPITDWQITINALTIVFPEDSIIPANGFYLIAKYKTGNPDSALDIEVDLDREGKQFSISNNGFTITLKDADSQIKDTAWDGTKPPSSGYGYRIANDGSASIERKTPISPGDLITSWQEATDSIHFDDNKDLGTPKSDNSIPPPPTQEPPIITVITPEETQAIDNFMLDQIDGDHFDITENLQIKLQHGTQEIWATSWQVLSPMLIIDIEFDLTDAEAGTWDVIVINPDQQAGMLINALTILELDEETGNNYAAYIQISEIYPRPTTGANDEFIELYNAGETSVNLKDWKLDDQYPGGSAIYTIDDDTIIAPDQYLAFSKAQTKISLNDSGDYVRLLNPQDLEIETTPNYGSANKGETYAKFDEGWKWTLRPTPNAENLWDNPNPVDNTDINNDPDSLEANKITIQMDADDITGTSVLLNWQISLIGAIGELKLYQSDNKNDLGKLIAQPDITQSDLLIENLQADTVYYFVLIGSYNADDIKSNQIKVTTEKSSTGEAVLGDISAYKQIIFTEILPNPVDGEEYIELFNPTDKPINLSGWKLQDASGRTYVITSFDLIKLATTDTTESNEVLLEPGEYLLLEYHTTHIRLNNSGGEELQLMDTDDNLIDEVYYDGTAKKGYAYMIAPNQTWFWSDETTPGTENDISFAVMDEDSGYYLIDTGKPLLWRTILWISLMISAIIMSCCIYYETAHQNN